MIEQIASDMVLDCAYDWLCKRRKKLSPNNEIWDFRKHWKANKLKLQEALRSGEYQFSPQTELRLPDGNIEYWSARDSLVLKAMAIVLGNHLATVISPDCYHVSGHGGSKQAVKDVLEHLAIDSYVMKSDVKSYYATIDHTILYSQLENLMDDKAVLRLLWQYMNRTVCYGETYRDIRKGISLGCPLSPLMGALYLKPLDDAMTRCGFMYARFMDDWVVIAPTRWKLRKLVRLVNEILAQLKVEKHPDKTFIGKAVRGFSFLGYFLKPGNLRVATTTINNMKERIARLYEQGACAARIGQYILRWVQWLLGGLSDYLSMFFAPCA